MFDPKTDDPAEAFNEAWATVTAGALDALDNLSDEDIALALANHPEADDAR